MFYVSLVVTAKQTSVVYSQRQRKESNHVGSYQHTKESREREKRTRELQSNQRTIKSSY